MQKPIGRTKAIRCPGGRPSHKRQDSMLALNDRTLFNEIQELRIAHHQARVALRLPGRVPPRQPPPPRQRMHEHGRPLCPQCGERDRVLVAGEADLRGEECQAPWCDRCMGYLAALETRPGRHVPDF